MSSHEFMRSSPLTESQENEESTLRAQAFLSISLKFDPYSLTAEDDYEALKNEVEKFDVIGLFRREIAKSHINLSMTKKILNALKYIDEPMRDQALLSICSSLNNLYPVFPTVTIVIKKIWPDILMQTKQRIGERIRELFKEQSHLIKTEINQQYACRLLSFEKSQENIELFQKLFSTTESTLIKQDIILSMFNWRYTAWLSDLRSQYSIFPPPLRRAFIIATYSLGDEGEHWRSYNKKNFTKFEKLIYNWAETKFKQKSITSWQIPL